MSTSFCARRISRTLAKKKHHTPTGGGDAVMTEADLPVSENDKAKAAKFPFHQVIGKLWWLALISRPDIVFAVHSVLYGKIDHLSS